MYLKALGKNPPADKASDFILSPNYKDGVFHNLSETPVTVEGVSFFKMLKDFLNKPANATPSAALPSVRTNLQSINTDYPVITWFGHSSYLIQYKTHTILVDPLLDGITTPVGLFGKSFPGTNIYTPTDFPQIDMMILTHDHYDHLDYKTIKKLNNKTAHYYVPLGVSSHLEYWGIKSKKITEFDWGQTVSIDNNIKLTATTARHFSGRGIARNKTLWTSYVLQLYQYKIFIGGDSGYDTHFRQIGDTYGPFDIAILETGQYNKSWPLIHMMPEEAVTASIELKAKVLLPVHWGKFALAYHPWYEPVERVLKAASANNVKVTTPMIGESVVLDQVYPSRTWWEQA